MNRCYGCRTWIAVSIIQGSPPAQAPDPAATRTQRNRNVTRSQATVRSTSGSPHDTASRSFRQHERGFQGGRGLQGSWASPVGTRFITLSPPLSWAAFSAATALLINLEKVMVSPPVIPATPTLAVNWAVIVLPR